MNKLQQRWLRIRELSTKGMELRAELQPGTPGVGRGEAKGTVGSGVPAWGGGPPGLLFRTRSLATRTVEREFRALLPRKTI